MTKAIRTNRLARTAIDVFNDIIERITVYKDHIDVRIPVNFDRDRKVILNADGFRSTLKMVT